MKFLHEYLVYGDGTRYDNGCWLIDGNLLVNRKGGHHFYKPKDDDEIVEADSWDDVLRLTVRKDDRVTGWIAPNGEFYGCDAQDHALLARLVFDADEITLENRRYVKIYELPMDVIRMALSKGEKIHMYEAATGRRQLTEQQIETLTQKGFVESGYEWIM